MFVVGGISDMGQPFRPRLKCWGLGWVENRLSYYNIHAEGALSSAITDSESKLKKWAIGFAMFLLGELIPK